MKFGNVVFVAALAGWLLPSGVTQAQSTEKLHWVGSWAASQQVPEAANLLDPELMRDATLREVVHLSVGGSAVAGAGVECVWDTAAASDGGACGAAGVGGGCGD